VTNPAGRVARRQPVPAEDRRAVLDNPGSVRVLLLARSLGEWRDRLAGESAPSGRRLLPAESPVLLDAAVADVPDADLAAAAVPFSAAGLGAGGT
jgi:hypothetical protein